MIVLNTCFAVMLGVILFICFSCAGGCPASEAEGKSKVAECYFNLGIDQNKLMNMAPDTVNKLCNNDAYRQIMPCVRDVYSTCEADNVLGTFIKNLENIDGITSILQDVCSSKQLLLTNQQCIEHAVTSGTNERCVAAQMSTYQEELNDAEVDPKNLDPMYRIYCNLATGLEVCLIPLIQPCGADVQAIMKRVIDLDIPSVCTSKGYIGTTIGRGTGGNTGTLSVATISTATMITSLIIALFILH